MTTVTDPKLTTALRRAAVGATRAPSIHNTQPWRFVLRRDALEIHIDPNRRLHVIDPRGRQLTLSCGCALFNARVAVAGAGYGAKIQRFPDPIHPDLLARIVIDDSLPPEPDLAQLDPAIDLRRTNRRRFSDEIVPDEIVDVLIDAAQREGAEMVAITRPDDRVAVARLSKMADEYENTDPAYRAEVRAWTSDDPSRPDGVQAAVVPHVDAGADDDLPIRDFDTRGKGALPVRTRSGLNQCLLLLGMIEDSRMAWQRAGEALERVLLEIAQRGYAVSPFTQVIELAHTNELLHNELRLRMYPHVLLRVGRAPQTPATRRRRLADVLTEAG